MKKSFTLVELMIVIAILAILSAIVIFTLNPTEIFKKNRDSIRLTDIQTLYKAITFMESWNTSGINIGNTNTIYISLPDSSSTCSSYSLPTLPTGYIYSCKTTENLKNVDSTGWIPIDFTISNNNNYISSLPTDPLNTINYYYSYNPGGSFEINSFLESTEYILRYASTDGGDSSNAYEKGTSLISIPLTFPHNWVKVPGSSLYNTSDFYVMQYEAKYSIDGRTGSDATDDCKNNTDYDTYDWNKSCSNTANQMTNVISSPLGSPIAGVTHTEAKAICEALGAHLITNQEW
jgi:prepilin-type N-terminal cleavage/methylation domain-containing protein